MRNGRKSPTRMTTCHFKFGLRGPRKVENFLGKGRAAEWKKPAACGGMMDMELARTRPRHLCGTAESVIVGYTDSRNLV